MSQPGIGAMLHYLSGGTEHEPKEYYGKVVRSAALNEDCDPERVEIVFEDDTIIHIWDDGQSCCESRYITCDDDWKSLIGGRLTSIETREAPEIEDDDWGNAHEQVFVDIRTDKGFVTFTTHNEHNGYYGGFGLTITEPDA